MILAINTVITAVVTIEGETWKVLEYVYTFPTVWGQTVWAHTLGSKLTTWRGKGMFKGDCMMKLRESFALVVNVAPVRYAFAVA